MSKLIEIERKFLPSNGFSISDIEKLSQQKYHISQGYISNDPERTVRIRTKNDKGYITIKGLGNKNGATRFEWEKEISAKEARGLLQLCQKGIIIKTRYETVFEGNIFEIDIFENENNGLVIIEIELESENQLFEKPVWLGAEVTSDFRYFNAYLSQNPFLEWQKV